MTDRASEPSSPAAALKRLRGQVERAAGTLKRLRRENEQLRARVEELEAHPGLHTEGTFVTLDDDPEVLREKVEAFINAIDHTLADEHARG